MLSVSGISSPVAPSRAAAARPSDDGDLWDELGELLAFRRAIARGEYEPDDFDLVVKDPDRGDGALWATAGLR